jgi:hypothetical protein
VWSGRCYLAVLGMDGKGLAALSLFLSPLIRALLPPFTVIRSQLLPSAPQDLPNTLQLLLTRSNGSKAVHVQGTNISSFLRSDGRHEMRVLNDVCLRMVPECWETPKCMFRSRTAPSALFLNGLRAAVSPQNQFWKSVNLAAIHCCSPLFSYCRNSGRTITS